MSILLESKQVKSLVVKQFVDEDLGNSSYLIASEESGLAAVIDPQRDDQQVDRAGQPGDGLQLRGRQRARPAEVVLTPAMGVSPGCDR